MEGIFELLRYAQSLDYLLIIITNQAGIARGYYSEEDFHHLNEWMVKQFKLEDITIDRVYYCPYHPTKGIGKYKIHSKCRKPEPGMILEACKDFPIDLNQSVLVGDKNSDIEAGQRAGVNLNILLRSSENAQNDVQADITVDKLTEIKSFL